MLWLGLTLNCTHIFSFQSGGSLYLRTAVNLSYYRLVRPFTIGRPYQRSLTPRTFLSGLNLLLVFIPVSVRPFRVLSLPMNTEVMPPIILVGYAFCICWRERHSDFCLWVRLCSIALEQICLTRTIQFLSSLLYPLRRSVHCSQTYILCHWPLSMSSFWPSPRMNCLCGWGKHLLAFWMPPWWVY